MPRLTYFSGLALLLLAGAFLLTDHLLAPAPGVTEANALRVRKGMSWAWVERVLGGPATEEVDFLDGRFGVWAAGAGLVAVEFDPAGRVTASGPRTGAQAKLIRAYGGPPS